MIFVHKGINLNLIFKEGILDEGIIYITKKGG